MTSNNKEQILHAIRIKDTAKIKYLLNTGTAPNICDISQTTILMHACENGWIDILEILIAKKADVNKINLNGKTALNITIASNNISNESRNKIFETLLKNGANPDLKNTDHTLPLMYATSFGMTELVELLVKYKANINTVTKIEKITPLILAAMQGKKDIVKILLENGADIDAQRKDGATALQLALEANQPSIANYLLSRGANPNLARTDTDACTPLMVAIYKRNFELAKDLINKYSADVDIASTTGWTTLMCAASNNEVGLDIFNLILSKKPKINIKAKNGISALGRAVSYNNTEKAKLLLEAGADANITDNTGTTPLMQTVSLMKNPENMAELLIRYGADMQAKDTCGKTALDIFNSLNRDNKKLAALLTMDNKTAQEYKLSQQFIQQTKKHNSMRKYIRNNRSFRRVLK